MTEETHKRPETYSSLVLRRRLFWLTLIIYLPLMLLSQKYFPGKNGLIVSFCVWVGLLIVTALFLALGRCPACGQTYHMNGMTFLPVRRCLHCGAHLKELASKAQ
ncbi:MAG: hypothetical protein C0624_11965 [Desulfuromonas sp.]|nr:MAG: hypothetical protein C0624_11965 [Desulfuromonas sp.]